MYDGPTSQFTTYYTVKQPRSRILIAECTKEWARAQVKAGAYPRGSIWYPGCCVGGEARPEIGDLFAPDDTWKRPTPLHYVKDDHLPHRR